MSVSRLMRYLLVLLLAVTILSLVFHFTLAMGCLSQNIGTPAKCLVDRQNQLSSMNAAQSQLIFQLMLPVAPAVFTLILLFRPLSSTGVQRGLLLSRDILRPPVF